MKFIAGVGVLFFTLLSQVIMAQGQEAMRKIESARIALITKRLDLTPEQAEKFWPVYNEYTGKRQNLREEYLNARRSINGNTISEEESRMLLEKSLLLKEKQLELDKTYSGRLTGVITSTQLLKLRKAEEDFRKMLMERLEHRRDKGRRLNNWKGP
jgi:Spy/CpxP family protein refolding chaperone